MSSMSLYENGYFYLDISMLSEYVLFYLYNIVDL